MGNCDNCKHSYFNHKDIKGKIVFSPKGKCKLDIGRPNLQCGFKCSFYVLNKS